MGRFKSFGVVAFAAAFPLLFQRVLYPHVLKELISAPRDDVVGQIGVLSAEELAAAYRGKRALVVGGTRGVGRGLSLALAGAGAHVTIVGRSGKSGARILEELRAAAPPGSEQVFEYVQGDLGSIASTNALIEALSSHAQAKGRFDYLATTAAVFPDWGAPLAQEDGLDKCFAIAVVGRYIVYKNIDKFMATDAGGSVLPHVRVLNVLASGGKMEGLQRAIAIGESNSTNMFDFLTTFAVGNEIMQMLLERQILGSNFGTTRVSTHPGFLKTDLHRGQGGLFDIVESLLVLLNGISEEDCGVRQASILASPALHSGSLSYVDDIMQARKASDELLGEFDRHSEWLQGLLRQKVA